MHSTNRLLRSVTLKLQPNNMLATNAHKDEKMASKFKTNIDQFIFLNYSNLYSVVFYKHLGENCFILT